MLERVTSNSAFAKAVRIALVFFLVFGISFQAESLAFGAVVVDDAQGRQQGSLQALEVWQVEQFDEDELRGHVLGGTSLADEEKPTAAPQLSSVNGTMRLVAVPTWKEVAAQEPGAQEPAAQEPAAQGDDTRIADFVEWSVDKPEVAQIEAKDGVATLTAKSAGTVTVTCTLKNSSKKLVSDDFAKEHPGKQFEVSFKVDVVAPYISAIEILQPDGTALLSGQDITLKEDERASYAFGARVRVNDGATGDALAEYTSAVGSLSDASDGLLSDFKWELVAADGSTPPEEEATIDDDGVLHMHKDGAFSVRCSVDLGAATAASLVNVKSGAEGTPSDQDPDNPEEDRQGAAHPQTELRVIADLGPAQPKGEEGQGSGGNGQNGSADQGGDAGTTPTDPGQGDQGQTPQNPTGSDDEIKPSAEGDAGNEGQPGDTPAAGNDNQPGGTEGTPADGAGSAGGAGGTGEGTPAEGGQGTPGQQPSDKVVIDKTYTADDLKALSSGTDTYTMYGADGFITVTGTGPYLSAILADAGIQDVTQIESLTFEDYRGVATTVSWSDLTAQRSYLPKALEGDYNQAVPASPMIAIDSYVHSAEEGTKAEKPQMVDNTRFRLLFGSTVPPTSSIDPDALRWINTIRVNVKAAQEEEPPNSAGLVVRVAYVPVPKGVTAVFSAVPNTAVGNARFGFYWQESTDNGVTWVDIPNSAVQTLRRVTSDENIGTMYRVVMETDIVDEKTGKKTSVTSEPVTMSEGNGFAVTLAYDPPVAGGTAIFQSNVLGVTQADVSEYVWEQSQDGGETWSVIAGREGPSLAVPTNPVVEQPADSSSSSDAVTPLIYVRVRAVAKDGRVAVSNEVPLTVRVEGGADQPQDPGTGTPGLPSDVVNPDQPVTPSNPNAAAEPAAPAVTLTEVSNIVVETGSTAPPTAPSQTEQAPPQASAQPQAQAPSEIYINSDVTDQIVEQREAEREAALSSTPGARWTELSTVKPTNDDVHRILSDNPFAPFVMPLALGVTFAGVLEKFLAFRRQL